MTQCTWVSADRWLSVTFNLSDCGLLQHAADDKFYGGNCWPPAVHAAKPQMAWFHWTRTSTVHQWAYTAEQQQQPQTLTGICLGRHSAYRPTTQYLAPLCHLAAGHCRLWPCLLQRTCIHPTSQGWDLEQCQLDVAEVHPVTRWERNLCQQSPQHSPPVLTSQMTECRDECAHCCQSCLNWARDRHCCLYK